MKIRNKNTGAEVKSPTMRKGMHNGEEVFCDETLSDFLYARDGWEEVGDEMDFVTKWRKIERDKDGFATEECLDEMFTNIPIVIRDRDKEHYVIEEAADKEGWRGDLESHPFYTHWLKLPKFEEEL